MNKIISAGFLAYIAVTSMGMFVVALIVFLTTCLFDRRLVVLHYFSSFWASIYLWSMPAWSISVEGRRNIRLSGTYVVVSNHQSQLDILMAFRLFFPFKWVSKAEVFRLPFIGWNMALNRYVKLYRGDSDSARTMMAQCEAHLREGSSVYFCPEGTRSETGWMRPFKPGAFILAHKMKTPILPVAINGTRHALPKNSVDFHGRHHLRITVLPEIPYERFKDLSVEETAVMVRDTLAAHIDEHRASPRQ